MQTIRRYANRKFYHVEGHRYVNLEEIAALVRAGEEVQVFEHPSGREMTPTVLAQIIVQERPAVEPKAVLTRLSALLASIIRWGSFPLGDAGRVILAGLGLPTRAQWQQLEEKVARLEGLLEQLLDEEERQVL